MAGFDALGDIGLKFPRPNSRQFVKFASKSQSSNRAQRHAGLAGKQPPDSCEFVKFVSRLTAEVQNKERGCRR